MPAAALRRPVVASLAARFPNFVSSDALEEEFDLAVDAAEFLRGPSVQLLPQLGADPAAARLLRSGASPQASVVERTGVDDGRGGALAAEHDEEIRDHGRLPIFVAA